MLLAALLPIEGKELGCYMFSQNTKWLFPPFVAPLNDFLQNLFFYAKMFKPIYSLLYLLAKTHSLKKTNHKLNEIHLKDSYFFFFKNKVDQCHERCIRKPICLKPS